MEIQDYPDYLIYDDGRVYNKKYKRFLKPLKNTGGYYHVQLWKNNKQKTIKIHRLVGLHYLPKVEGKDIIDHINGDKLNNHVNNLRWVTQQENCNNYKSIQKNNTLGFKNISPYQNGFRFQKNIYGKYYSKFHKIIYGKQYTKYHKNLNELHWYKFVFLLQNI